MGFTEELGKNSSKIDTIYDFASFCYDYLIDNIGDMAQFLGTYILDNDQAQIHNPNLKKLLSFSNCATKIFQNQETEGWLFRDCLEKLIGKTKNIEMRMIHYGNSAENNASIVFFLLWGIDRYITDKRKRPSEGSPLNHSYREKSLVYLDTPTALDEAIEINAFSDIIEAPTINNLLKGLNILEIKSLPAGVGIPKIASLWISEHDQERIKIAGGKKLKIALIPFSKEKMLSFSLKGSLFSVKYLNDHKENDVKRALQLLNSAIKKKANIIIFPEFICGTEIQEAIQKRLIQIYQEQPNELNALLFVLAGSAWTEDNNNVAFLYSYNGILLGKQYKYSRFWDTTDNGNSWIENLQNPGLENTIIEIPGFGKAVIGICRDISEQKFTKLLTKIFNPLLLLVPAWSPSVHIGFEEQFNDIVASTHKTSCILCNCCEAFHKSNKFRTDISIVVTPFKKGSVVTGRKRMIKRTEEACLDKCKTGGCIFMIEMNFDAESVKNGKIVKRIRHIFCG